MLLVKKRDKCVPTCAVDTNNDRNKAPDTYKADLPGAGKGIMYYYASSFLQLEWTAQHGCGSKIVLINVKSLSSTCAKIHPLGSEMALRVQRLAVVIMKMVATHKITPLVSMNGYFHQKRRPRIKSMDNTKVLNTTINVEQGRGTKDFSPQISFNQPLGNRQQSILDKETMGNVTDSNVLRKGIISKSYCSFFKVVVDYLIFSSLNQPILASPPWRDIAVLTDDTSRCKYYQKNLKMWLIKVFVSLKIMTVCRSPLAPCNYNENARDAPYDKLPIPNTRAACEDWNSEYTHQKTTWKQLGNTGRGPLYVSAPVSKTKSSWQRDGWVSAAYEWQIPYDVPEILNKKCVLRVRYNISSNDFDGWNTFVDGNKLISANPTKDWLGQGYNVRGPLRININTAQFFEFLRTVPMCSLLNLDHQKFLLFCNP